MDHGDANGDCARCHPSGGSDWTCFGCHNEQETIREHDEDDGNIIGRCMECHADGHKDDDAPPRGETAMDRLVRWVRGQKP
jgi:hypothetical protein